MKIGKHEIELSNEDKKLFPDGITKGDIIEYYNKVSKRILPFMEDRPLVMKRFPDSINEGFYQKEEPDYFPKWIDTVDVEKEKNKKQTLVVCNNKASLIYLANQAVISPHLWLSRKNDLHTPDMMVFDLDPSGKNFETVKEGAKQIKKIMDKIKLRSFVKTTGSKGLHVVVPLKPEHRFTKIRNFARVIGEYIADQNPKEFTKEHRKEKRKGRVFMDYMRNAYGQTAVAPYGVRPIKDAPIAVPIPWNELNRLESSQRYNIKNMPRKKNPWEGYNYKQVIREGNIKKFSE